MTHSIASSRELPATHRRHRLVAVLAAAALGVGLTAGSTPAHAADAGFCPDGSQPYATVAEVEAFAPDTAVTGLSVTKGTTPDPFSGSYIGFIDDALGKDRDMLLFKLSSPVIDGTSGLKPAGIWAGMSGSPVYTTDGKLIGAVAYSLNYDNLPVAGVTPAEYMKNIGTTGLTTTAKVKVTKGNLKTSSAGIKAAGDTLVGRALTPVRTVNVAGVAGTKSNAFVNRTLARTPRSAAASSFLRSGTFLPAGVSSANAVPQPLVAGGSIAALYGDGDLFGGAIGTVTAVCGDGPGATVWAFGHPMFGEGKTTLMMANVSTALIVPDGTGMVGSYKQHSQLGAPVGMIDQDRLVGIRGTVGDIAAFPVTVDIQNPSGNQVASYSGNVSYQSAAASAAAYLIGQATYEQLDQYGSGTAEVTWTIDYRRADNTTGSLTNSQIVSARYMFPDILGSEAANDVYEITENPYEDVAIAGIHATVKLVSSDSLSYKVSGVQVKGKTGAWTTLSGSKLKAGSTYSLRPQYTVKKNGKSSGTVFGDPLSVKLSSKARKSGSFEVTALTELSDPCDEDSEECDDWATGEDPYEDFDELVAALDEHPTSDLVVGQLTHRLKKGSTSKVFDLTGPGVVTGSRTASFTIKS